MAYTQLQHLPDDITAIRTALDFHDGPMPSAEEEAFLGSSSNKETRRHIFNGPDFISLTVLPNNLMPDTGNTEAPSHLLVLQTHSDKTDYSPDEMLLMETMQKSNEFVNDERERIITARYHYGKTYLYKLSANVSGIVVSLQRLKVKQLRQELPQLTPSLQQYKHDFYFEGDQHLNEFFNFGKHAKQYYQVFYGKKKEGSLVSMDGQHRFIHDLDEKKTQAAEIHKKAKEVRI